MAFILATIIWKIINLEIWLITSWLIHDLNRGYGVLEDQYFTLCGQEKDLIGVERVNGSRDRLAS